MDIIIDHRIRDWVFIPLIFVMFMVSVFRFYLTQYTENRKTAEKITSKSSVSDLVDKQIIKKAGNLHAFNGILSESSFKMRRAYLCDHNSGVLTKASLKPAKDAMASMSMMNPATMVDMLKGNLSAVVSMAFQYKWVSYFFSGFVIGKVPFPLTQKFRGMLQSGVDIQNLDVRYISSLSLYYLILFGVSKLHGLMFSGDDEDEIKPLDEFSNMNMAMMPMAPMQMPGQANNAGKSFLLERDNLESVKHTFKLDTYKEKAVLNLKRYLKQK